jgi:hypothetical protein
VYGCLGLSKLRAHPAVFTPVRTKVRAATPESRRNAHIAGAAFTRENGSDRRKTLPKASFCRISLLVLGVFLPQFSLEYRIGLLLGRLA